MLQRLDFNENPNIGVFCRINDKVAFIRKGLLKKIKKKIISATAVKLVEMSIADTSIIGSLLAVNSHGAVLTNLADDENVRLIEAQGLDVYVIEDKFNAAGNDILVNDYGALVHPDIKRGSLNGIHKVLDVPVFQGTIGVLKTVGMAAVVTNKGLLSHPKILSDEKKMLESVFGVDVHIGTVNHGVPLIGSGLIANSEGAIMGTLTTGIEMGRIEESLGFL